MTNPYAERRRAMVREQLEERGLRSPRVLEAMGRVPREKFVAAHLADFAYDDGPLPIGEGQTISQPFMVAVMVDALGLEGGERVLEIGTGCGYAAAVLAELAGEVFTIERHEGLARSAEIRLAELGYRRVHARCGDGTWGWPEEAPFDRIVVAAAGPTVPEALRAQLAIGGKLLMPVGAHGGVQVLRRITRVTEHEFSEEDLGEVRFVPLIVDEG